MQQKYPPSKVIAIDVDGTLIINGVVNDDLVAWCKARKNDGFCMILWSARGEKHAKNAAKTTKLEAVFNHILSKPSYIVDDKGWSWIKYTRVIKSLVNKV
jgi:hydroxymethylpyrimidine pyrophosphatase-like HAD family hydrolase